MDIPRHRATMRRLGLVAQLVEQRIENPCVGGSIPPRATKNILDETPIHADRRFCFRNGKSSCPVHFRHNFNLRYGRLIAQPSEAALHFSHPVQSIPARIRSPARTTVEIVQSPRVSFRSAPTQHLSAGRQSGRLGKSPPIRNRLGRDQTIAAHFFCDEPN
jgi:hypothetical protein